MCIRDRPGGNNWQLVINFVKSIINVLTVAQDAIRIAVVDFGTTNLFNFLYFRFLDDAAKSLQ